MTNNKEIKIKLAEDQLSSSYGVYEYTTFDNAFRGVNNCISSTNILKLNNMFVTCVNYQVSKLIRLGFKLIDTYHSTSANLIIVDYKLTHNKG